jgi:hypothetical protein
MDSGWIAVPIILAIFGTSLWSIGRILQRMGLSPFWVFTMGLWPIMLPILATCRRPAFDELEAKAQRTLT